MNKKGWTVIVTSNIALLFVKQYVNSLHLAILNTKPLCLPVYLWQASTTKRDL